MKTARKKPKKPLKKKLPRKPIPSKKKVATKKQNTLANQIDQIFAPWDKTDSPGFALAVRHNGSVVYSRGYGMADLDHNIANAPDTVFHAASLTKQFTAMAIMLLITEPGLANTPITLATNVHTLVPQLSRITQPITIGQMLHHISGIRDQWVLATMAGWRLSDDVITRHDVVERFVARSKSLNFNPGDQFSYSNTNYTIAGEIVRKVAGMTLSAFCDKYIFKPLGMTRSKIIENHGEIVKDRAYGYRGTYPSFEVRMPNYDLTGPTNLQTTVEDLMRWDRNFDQIGVGSAAALAAMQTPVPASEGYGLGLFIETENGHRIVEHNGRDAGYRSHLIRFPDQKLSVALLCNLALPDDPATQTWTLVRKVAALYLGTSFALMAAPPDLTATAAMPASPSEYFGRYYSDEIDATYTLKLNAIGTFIAITRDKYPPTDLLPAGPDTFIMKNFSVVLPQAIVLFERTQGHISGFRMDDTLGGRLSNFRFVKVD